MRSKNILFALPLAVVLAGCNGATSVSGIESTETTPTPSAEPVACQTSTLDKGAKGNVAGVARGIQSDLKLNPLTSLPGVAYFDTGALGIKFSYSQNGTYVHEYISGAPGTVNSVALGFLSTGIPVVMWTAATADVFVASRSAALGTAGTWSSKVLASIGTASRAIELSVNPANQVAAIYLTDTAATGRPKFVSCASGCGNINNYSTQDGSNFIDNTAIVGAQTQLGVAWCGADTNADAAVDTYYPAVVYGGNTNAMRFASCRNTLATCLTTAGWTATSALAASANVAASLYIDPTVVSDIPRIASQRVAAAAGFRLYHMGAVGCASAPAAFTETNPAVGTTTTGNLWINLMKDAAGRFHIVANEGTAAVRYYNTDSTIFNTATGWNTGAVLNTTTLGASNGGADIDRTGAKIWSSHYSGAATNRFNLVLNLNPNSAIAADNGSFTSTNFIPNTDGAIDLTSANVRNVIVDTTSDDRAGAVYVDFSAGSATTGVLKYAFRSGSQVDSSWSVVTVPNLTAPVLPFLRFDASDKPWLSVFDVTALRFLLITNSASDGSGTWTTYTFPTTPTGSYTLPATNSTSLAMRESGGVSYPVMAVIDSTNATVGQGQGLKAARLDPATGVWSVVSVIDAMGASDATSLYLDSVNGHVVAAYKDITTNVVEYSYSANGGTTWSTPFVVSASTAGMGLGLSIKLNPLTNAPVITHQDRLNNRLWRATCSSAAASCVTSGWATDILDTYTGLGTTFTTTTTDQLISSSAVMRDDGAYDIFYTHGMLATGNMKRLKVDDAGVAAASNTNWLTGQGGTLTTAVNFGLASLGFNAALTSNNHLITVGVGVGNALVQKTCDLDIQD